jgi:type IV pilus assembly protein PilV
MPVNNQRGSSLIEALIALLILSIAILGIIGLQANLLRIGSQAQYRMQASLLAQNIAGMISVDGPNVGCYALVARSDFPCPASSTQGAEQAQAWREEVLATLPNASEPSIAVAANRIATVTLSWKAPNDPATRNLVLVVQPIQ